jgi:transcriptional regulator with XRE-family HTH domain
MARTRKEEKAIRRAVGVAIEQRRADAGIGVDALAKAAQVDTSQMGKVLRGECGLSLYSLSRVARVLGCAPGALLPDGSHDPSLPHHAA